MMTTEQILELLKGQLDRHTLEIYVARAWVRPIISGNEFQFEEIDLARIKLVRHLQRDILINEDGVDIVLHLLDQLYEVRGRSAVPETTEVTTAEFWEII